ncbi:unnamed protein product, partial [marine sediment metagenome]
MKKLAFFLIVLISLTVMAGCKNTRKEVTRFKMDESGAIEVTEENGAKTTIAKLDEDDKEAGGVEFAVTSLEKNITESDKGYHLVQGTTPKNTAKIVVNNYPLNKYKPGDTEWSYIAAVSLGTLKKGENYYSIRALDADGKVIGSERFTIFYKGIDNGMLISTGNNLMLSLILTIVGLFGFY